MFSEIKHHYDRAKVRAERGVDTTTFDTIKVILTHNGLDPNALSSQKIDMPSPAEIELYELLEKVENHHLVDQAPRAAGRR